MGTTESPTRTEAFTGADRLADIQSNLRDAERVVSSWRRTLRDEVVRLVDVVGVPRAVVGRVLGISKTRIHAILTQHYASAAT